MSRKSLSELGPRQRRQRLMRLLVDSPRNINFQQRIDEPVQVQQDEHEEHHDGFIQQEDLQIGVTVRNENQEFVHEIGHDYPHSDMEETEYSDTESDSSSSQEVGDDEHEERTMIETEANQETEFPNNANELLYEGATLTVADSMLLILSIFLHHNVTLTCLADIITAINLHCPNENLKENSLHKFQQYFSIGAEKKTVKKHYYCSICTRALENERDVCPSCTGRKRSYYVQLPFLDQLKEMYKRSNFFDLLEHRFQRSEQSVNLISDVYDGNVYKNWVNNGFLKDPKNISFTWYTDGISVFKSSHISIWPLYLCINELPPTHRKKRENVLLAGVWFGDKKPDMMRFLDTFYSDFEELRTGIEIYNQRDNITINVKGILLMGTCDLPAKSECMNFKYFNSYYGCPSCMNEAEEVRLPTGGRVRVHRYTNELPLRTLTNCIEYANSATPDTPIYGVKGHTPLSYLMPDFIEGMAIDRMHCVDGGVIKKLLTLLFNEDYRSYSFSLYAAIDVVNDRLQSIKPPKFMHRMPRSVRDLIHWKTSELKSWFFYYSIPVLNGIMNNNYLEHYKLIVISIAILNSDIIRTELVAVARNFLHKFVREFETLYGIQFSSINVHQLLHLPDCVLKFGPLWVYSCYEYEDMNGQLLNLIHGTSHIDTQIVKSHNYFITMPRLIERLPEGNIRDFCLKRKRQVKIIEKLFTNCYSVGSYKHLQELSNIIQTAFHNSNVITQNAIILQYMRLLKNNRLYVASTYNENLQTSSYAILYQDENFLKVGLVHSFIKLINCECRNRLCRCSYNNYAIVQNTVYRDTFYVVGNANIISNSQSFLIECYVTNDVSAIKIESIIDLCFYITIDDRHYIGIPVNSKELE